jgi:hypothetical protein
VVEGTQGEDRRFAELIQGGGEVAGAAVGSVLGLLGGPVGVAAGAFGGVVVTRALKHVGAEVSQRLLSPREKVRMGGVLALAANEIREEIEAGKTPREDGFFEAGDTGRIPADELLEGVLLHAAREYEERKLRYVANFYVSLVFTTEVSAEAANYLLRLIDDVTYRQLLLIRVFGDKDRFRAALEESEVSLRERARAPLIAGELDDLAIRGVMSVPGEGGISFAGYGTPTFQGRPLGDIDITPVGQTLIDLMGLREMPPEDVQDVLRDLQGPGLEWIEE